LVLAAIVANFVVYVWFVGNSAVNFANTTTVEKHMLLLECQGAVVYYDEVLTMSAHMTACTSNYTRWGLRYLNHTTPLDDVINEIMRTVPGEVSEAFRRSTDIVNIRLVELETRVLNLVQENRSLEAQNIMNSDEYMGLKEIYKSGFDALRQYIGQEAVTNRDKIRSLAIVSVAFVAVATALMVGVSALTYRGLKRNTELVVKEQLLQQILPDSIARQIRSGAVCVAEHHQSVTVAFADIVCFTRMSSRLNAQGVLGLLEGVFEVFDRNCPRHNIEKIKTVGDCYMATANLNITNTNHTLDMLEFLMAVIEEMERKNANPECTQVTMRFGINTGPVIAGVLGCSKCSFDIWGDTVNIASRMESSGKAMMIRCTQPVYDVAKDVFTFERERIDVRNRGMMDTFVLITRHDADHRYVSERPPPAHEPASCAEDTCYE
jgi:class 3 adenylate cyclase